MTMLAAAVPVFVAAAAAPVADASRLQGKQAESAACNWLKRSSLGICREISRITRRAVGEAPDGAFFAGAHFAAVTLSAAAMCAVAVAPAATDAVGLLEIRWTLVSGEA